ncbi:MAG: TonB family protein [Tistlia sp.]|uniref:TonB family protein n=1 Tax=Tistlia sp. TaxID=3057121 RepID=UPI0034A1F497
MELGRRHWLAAFAVALAIHALVAGVWLWQAPPSGAASAGLGGVSVSLGPAGGAPGSVDQESDATTEAEPVSESEVAEEVPTETIEAAESETQEVTPPEPEAVRPPEPEVAEAAEVPVAEPLTEPLEAQVAEAEPAAEPVTEPEVTEAVEPETTEAKAEPFEIASAVAPPPPPKPRDLPEAPQPAKRPEPQPAPEAEPAEQVAAAPTGPPAPAADSVAGAGGKSGTQAAPEAGSAPSQSGGGLPGASADYLSLLQAWLEKHKEYPRHAQSRRQEGTVMLHFVMDRQGHVLEYRIQRSSGHGLLDREVEEMIRRADPLPRMPDEMSEARLELVIPVQFLLR